MTSGNDDPQSRGERAAWWVQRQFRRWTVLIVLNLIAVAWLLLGNSDLRTWWNFVWSALAVDVEFITALALVSMSRRDHERLIRMERMEAMNCEELERLEKIIEHLENK